MNILYGFILGVVIGFLVAPVAHGAADDARDTFEVSVETPDFSLDVLEISEDGVEELSVESESFGEDEADAAQTGLCAVGLSGELPFGVGDDGSIDDDLADNDDKSPFEGDGKLSERVLEECTEW